MEVFGSAFDDSVFEESRNRNSSADLPTYEPKSCEPEWFCHTETYEDELDEQKTMKFRGDLKYRKKQYQSAIEDYTACLSLVPNNNLSVRRDVLEGLARCWSHLGRREQALEACEKLRMEATNTCHLTCLFQLELSIHEAYGNLRKSILCLEQLCALHPFNQWHWFKLANSYEHLLESNSSTILHYPEDEIDAKAQIQKQPEAETTKLKACMCLVRTRLLIEILKIQQFSFVLERSKKTLKDVDESLQRLKVDKETLRIIFKTMAEDLIPEKMREEKQDGESLTGFSMKDFEKSWWNKLHSCLLLEEKTHLFCDDREDNSRM